MTMWQIMLGMGIGVIVTVGITLINMMSTQKLQAAPGAKRSSFCSTPNDPCPICLENMTNEEMHYLKCSHAICENCYRSFRLHGDNKCPTCRHKI